MNVSICSNLAYKCIFIKSMKFLVHVGLNSNYIKLHRKSEYSCLCHQSEQNHSQFH
ncbi:uncharacterized protein DS421_4g113600 [Arachis hypogaea]|nr:uncharacterized protein DS421_4g113600 [Arachis hypogaea]